MPKLMQRYHEDRISGMRTVLSGLNGRIDALEATLEHEDDPRLVARLEAFKAVKFDIIDEIAREEIYT